MGLGNTLWRQKKGPWSLGERKVKVMHGVRVGRKEGEGEGKGTGNLWGGRAPAPRRKGGERLGPFS